MKAFISYSHKDDEHLITFEKHLAQVKREGLLSLWTDHAIEAGGLVNKEINKALNVADIFIALLSPDYINSGYCYEKEFQYAHELQDEGKLKIVPIIVEPCDWLSTPFKEFKALPKDGKPISTWINVNTAFLDVVTSLRSLLSRKESGFIQPTGNTDVAQKYRAQRDFDTIEKIDFVNAAFKELKEKLKANVEEVINVEGIKAKLLSEDDSSFSYLLVNRNKKDMEATITVSKSDHKKQNASSFTLNNSDHWLEYEISSNNREHKKSSFNLQHNEYKLFWTKSDYRNYSEPKQVAVSGILIMCWNDWLSSIGIDF